MTTKSTPPMTRAAKEQRAEEAAVRYRQEQDAALKATRAKIDRLREARLAAEQQAQAAAPRPKQKASRKSAAS